MRYSFAPPVEVDIRFSWLSQQPFYGPATFFVSHPWAGSFEVLVQAVLRHYDSLAGEGGGGGSHVLCVAPLGRR